MYARVLRSYDHRTELGAGFLIGMENVPETTFPIYRDDIDASDSGRASFLIGRPIVFWI